MFCDGGIPVRACCAATKFGYKLIWWHAVACALYVVLETMHGSVQPPHMQWGKVHGKRGWPCGSMRLEVVRWISNTHLKLCNQVGSRYISQI